MVDDSDNRYASGMENRLKHLREERGMTQEEVAAKLGMHVTNYNKLENSKTNLTPKKLEMLAAVLFVDPISIIVDMPATRMVRVEGPVQAGIWAESWETPDEDKQSVFIPDDADFRGMRLHAAETRGPSMDRVYPEGTVVVFTDFIERGEDLVFGKRYAVERQRADGLRERTVKLLWRDENDRAWLLPESTDPRFQEPIPLHGSDGDTIQFLGRVVYSVRRE